VFSFRDIENCDSDLIEEWKKISQIHIQMDLPKDHKLPSEFIFCFYWIEVGKASIESNRLTIDIFEKQFIQMIDIGVALDLLLEHLNQTDSH
jgi:hypothetical protein